MAAFFAAARPAGHCGEALRADLDRWRCFAVAFPDAIQAPLAFLQVVAKPERVADVIEHYRRWFARCWPQASTDHLQMQAHRLRWPQQDATADAWHIYAFTDQRATGQHLQPSGFQRLQQISPAVIAHGAIDAGRSDALADEQCRHCFGMGNGAAKRNRSSAA